MYLARRRVGKQIHYDIRESYLEDGCWKSRHLFNLGADPARHIIYPGGHGYYYNPDIIDALDAKGLKSDQSDLDVIFFEFLSPRIQRIIDGFDRGRRFGKLGSPQQYEQECQTLHLFDMRRFFFLRFGPRTRQQIRRVPQKVFNPLRNKSRDELEQYFINAERALNHLEKPRYVVTIFELNRFVPKPEPDTRTLPQTGTLPQLDDYFLSKLCQLDRDSRFWQAHPEKNGLHEYLIKYAIMYFDFERPQQDPGYRYFQEFINRHRAYSPPKRVKESIKAAENLFGLTWAELKDLSRQSLSRRYRRLCLKHHPDHGGDPAQFDRLTQIYRQLLNAKS